MAKFFRVLTHRLVFGKRGDVVRLDQLTGEQKRALVAAGHVEPSDGPEYTAPEPEPEPEPEPAAPVAEPEPEPAPVSTPSDDASGAASDNPEGA